jgi:cAMP phosphodiesterase
MIEITFDHLQMAKTILGHPHVTEVFSDYLFNGKIRFTLEDQQYLRIHYLSIQAQMPSP